MHPFLNFKKQTQKYEIFKKWPLFSEAKEIKKQETLVRFSIISYKTRLRVIGYWNNQNTNWNK